MVYLAENVRSQISVFPSSIEGTVTISGSKNSAPKLIAASLLSSDEVTIGNVPQVTEVTNLAHCLTHAGTACRYDPNTQEIIISDERKSLSSLMEARELGNTRLGISLIPALLKHTGTAHIPLPSGDRIGKRHLDIHLDSLLSLGAEICEAADTLSICLNLESASALDYRLRLPSVMATENLLMLCSCIPDVSRLKNCGNMPEIDALAAYLSCMGAHIVKSVDNNSQETNYYIEGTSHLRGATRVETPPDHNSAVTWLTAGALLGEGEGLDILNINIRDIEPFLQLLDLMGIAVVENANSLKVKKASAYQSTDKLITTEKQAVAYGSDDRLMMYSDWQAMVSLLLLFAEGPSTLIETSFDSRMQHLKAIQKANPNSISFFNGFSFYPSLRYLFPEKEADYYAAHIYPDLQYSFVQTAGEDIRTSAFTVLFGLRNKQGSRLTNSDHLERGYPLFIETLRALGADIISST